jgi:hypothetical protein
LEGGTFRTPRIHRAERYSFPFGGISLPSLESLACKHRMCFDVPYMRKSCNGCEEFPRVVGTGGVRSGLTKRLFHGDELATVLDSQSFEKYINPSYGGRRVDIITGEMW